MSLRKAILSWRDRWSRVIDQRLQADLLAMQSLFDTEIDAMHFSSVIYSNAFIQDRLQPVLRDWVEFEASCLIANAETDLLLICADLLPELNGIAGLDEIFCLKGLKGFRMPSRASLKSQMQQQLTEKIIYSKKNTSLNLLLNQYIDDVAINLIRELKHAG
jgi:hypothetical protein